jgi:hypothetical protein
MSADVIVLALVHIQANATTATISRQGGVTLASWRFGEPPRLRVDIEWTSWGHWGSRGDCALRNPQELRRPLKMGKRDCRDWSHESIESLVLVFLVPSDCLALRLDFH